MDEPARPLPVGAQLLEQPGRRQRAVVVEEEDRRIAYQPEVSRLRQAERARIPPIKDGRVAMAGEVDEDPSCLRRLRFEPSHRIGSEYGRAIWSGKQARKQRPRDP